MKNITLPLFISILLFFSGHAQQSENNTIIRSNHVQADTNSIDQNFITSENTDVLSISVSETNTANRSSDLSTTSAAARDENLFIITTRGALEFNASPVTVNLSSGISPALNTYVSYRTLQRVWRLEAAVENTPTVTVKIPATAIQVNSEEGNYYMFISQTGAFNSTTDHQPMTLDERGNFVAEYNFTGVSYITFGFAPKVTAERSIYFNGQSDYIDMQDKLDLNPSGFTISAWIKPNINQSEPVSILSKRYRNFEEGYDLTLTENKLGFYWKNPISQSLISNTTIPNEEWHHVAITYDGSVASLYIDGVLDNTVSGTAPIDTKASFLIAAAAGEAPIQHFKGQIDEVRIWKKYLDEVQLRFIMNQEIDSNSGLVIGKVSQSTYTKNEASNLSWSDLAGYYSMSEFTYKNVLDGSRNSNNGQLKNLNTVDLQTAPLPFISQQNGNWNNIASWKNGRVQYSPGSPSIVDPNITIDWNIVKTAHDLTMDNSNLPSSKNNNRTLLALYVEANEITLSGDTDVLTGNGLTVTHYLELGGTIDLDGESQLIQTANSDLNVLTNGKIERDQQGTADTYTYNYWSSPVTKENATYNSFKITDVMKDGTSVNNALSINFSSSGYDGAATSPIKIADYWIWKYANQSSINASSWQHVRRTGTIFPGEGFTMKGPGSGSIESQQNYIFTGKPNNGEINLTLAANNEYLVGNPYPSAIDANTFILNNGPNALISTMPTIDGEQPTITGTLYFWKHWGGGSHISQEYQGGYAIYNLSGAVAAATKGTTVTGTIAQQLASQKPGRYIPVGQGFFVVGEGGGSVTFNNNQRVFRKETAGTSLFLRSSNSVNAKNLNENDSDDRMKFRVRFNSVNDIHRQLLLTIDENATLGVDWGYDGKMNEDQIDDMYWIINNEKYIIQGSNEAEVATIYPIGIKTNSDGINSINIDDLENIPDDFKVYVHDIELDIYHNLRTSAYEFFLNAGEYLNRFEITFGTAEEALSITDEIKDSIAIIYSNDLDRIVLINPNQIEVKSIAMYNLLGQSVYTLNDLLTSSHSEYEVNNLSSGAYIIKLSTANNVVMTKKIVVN